MENNAVEGKYRWAVKGARRSKREASWVARRKQAKPKPKKGRSVRNHGHVKEGDKKKVSSVKRQNRTCHAEH